MGCRGHGEFGFTVLGCGSVGCRAQGLGLRGHTIRSFVSMFSVLFLYHRSPRPSEAPEILLECLGRWELEVHRLRVCLDIQV